MAAGTLAGPPIDRPRLSRRGLARRTQSARPLNSVATLRHASARNSPQTSPPGRPPARFPARRPVDPAARHRRPPARCRETSVLGLILALQKYALCIICTFPYIGVGTEGRQTQERAARLGKEECGEGRRAAAPFPPSCPRVPRGSFNPWLWRPSVQHWGRAEPRFL